jgi:hypothetical protein
MAFGGVKQYVMWVQESAMAATCYIYLVQLSLRIQKELVL